MVAEQRQFFHLNNLCLWSQNSRFHRTIWDMGNLASGFLLGFFSVSDLII